MKIQTTTGILLKKIPYSDFKFILKIYTKDFGISAFSVNVNKKKAGLRSLIGQPLSLVEVEYIDNGSEIRIIKNINLSYTFNQITHDIEKQCIMLFMNEMILQSLQLPQNDKIVYDFLINYILFLDKTTEKLANFPIVFTLELSKSLGFGPSIPDKADNFVFNLHTGKFVQDNNLPSVVMDTESSQFLYQLLTSENPLQVPISRKDRNTILLYLLDYFSFHGDFNPQINSYETLKTIFD